MELLRSLNSFRSFSPAGEEASENFDDLIFLKLSVSTSQYLIYFLLVTTESENTSDRRV